MLSHSQSHPASPYISRWCQGWNWTRHQRGSRSAGHSQKCWVFPCNCPVGSEHSFLISFPLRNDDSICSMLESLSSTCSCCRLPRWCQSLSQGTATSPTPQHWDTQPLPAARLCLLLLGSSLWEDLMNLNIYLINRKCSCFPLLNLVPHYPQSILTSVPPDWILSSELLKGFNLRGRAQGRAASDWNWKKPTLFFAGKETLFRSGDTFQLYRTRFGVGGV